MRIVGIIQSALFKFDPRDLRNHPILAFLTLTAISLFGVALLHLSLPEGRDALIVSILFFAFVMLAHVAEAIAEAYGRAYVSQIRIATGESRVRRLRNDIEEDIPTTMLQPGDRILVKAGEVIVVDGRVAEGVAVIDESAITGESAPVIREADGERSSLTAGTRVLSESVLVLVGTHADDVVLARMIGLVEERRRQPTPNEAALSVLTVGLTLLAILLVTGIMISLGARPSLTTALLAIALLGALMPMTLAGLRSTIGIAGMNRILRSDVLVTTAAAIEIAGNIDTLLIDKTGTITLGARDATELIVAPGVDPARALRAVYLSSIADDTPEGRSVVALALRLGSNDQTLLPNDAVLVPFDAYTRMSGVDLPDATQYRKGAPDAILSWVASRTETIPTHPLQEVIERIARNGDTPLLVADQQTILGVLCLRDMIKPHMRERFQQLRTMGIRTVMITGDNPLTASAIAREAGVDDFLAEATPSTKMTFIRREQNEGRLVAMTGDGTNDAPALAQADIGIAMSNGTQAAKDAANVVDLDSDPAKLIEIVEIGKQVLMTRGALSIFSIAYTLGTYALLLPKLFAAQYPLLETFDFVPLLHTFSAIVAVLLLHIVTLMAMMPLAFRGVAYRPTKANAVLRKHLLLYGIRGLLAPWFGLTLIARMLQIAHLSHGITQP